MGRGQGKAEDPFAAIFGRGRGGGRDQDLREARPHDGLDVLGEVGHARLQAMTRAGISYVVQVGPANEDGVLQPWGAFEQSALAEARRICKRLQLKKLSQGTHLTKNSFADTRLDEVEPLKAQGSRPDAEAGLHFLLTIDLKLQRPKIDEYSDLVRRLAELAVPASILVEHGLNDS